MADLETPETVPENATWDAVSEPAPRRHRVLVPLLSVAGLLLLAFFLFRWLGPKPVPPPKVIAYSPQQAATAQQHLDELGAQLTAPAPVALPSSPSPASQPQPGTPPSAAPSRAVSTNVPKPPTLVRMELSQADLNTYLATDRKVKSLLAARGIQTVQIVLHAPNNVVCRAAVLYKGRKTNVQIAGALLPSPDSIARLDTTQAQIGSLPLPAKAVTAQASRIADQFLGHWRGRMPVQIQTIQVIGDRLILTGVRRPSMVTPDAADSPQSASPGRR